MTEKIIYLDNAAAMPINQAAYEILIKSHLNDYANPTGTHPLGLACNKKINQCRDDFLKWLGANDDYQVIFTSSATESNNTIIRGLDLKKDDEIFFSEADHPSQSLPCKSWAENNVTLNQIKLKINGQIDEEDLLKRINDKTRLICFNCVNGLAGIYYSLNDLAKKIKAKNSNCHIHVDAAQGFGKMPLNLNDSMIDSVTIASYKLGGPKGIAALVLKKSTELKPLLLGGNHEFGKRASTPATPLILGFHKACEQAIQSQQQHFEQLTKLNESARQQFADTKIQIPFELKQTSPYFLLLIVPGIPADVISRHLENKNIIINTRTSCSAKDNKPTPMLSALNIDKDYHRNVLRVSFSYYTTQEQIDIFCKTLKQTIDLLDKLNP